MTDCCAQFVLQIKTSSGHWLDVFSSVDFSEVKRVSEDYKQDCVRIAYTNPGVKVQKGCKSC